MPYLCVYEYARVSNIEVGTVELTSTERCTNFYVFPFSWLNRYFVEILSVYEKLCVLSCVLMPFTAERTYERDMRLLLLA